MGYAREITCSVVSYPFGIYQMILKINSYSLKKFPALLWSFIAQVFLKPYGLDSIRKEVFIQILSQILTLTDQNKVIRSLSCLTILENYRYPK